MSASATLCACGTWSRSTSPPGSSVPAARPPSFATMATLSAACMPIRRGRAVSAIAASVRRDLARFDQLFPAGVLGGLEPGELLGRVGDDLETLRHQLVLDRRVVQRGHDGA